MSGQQRQKLLASQLDLIKKQQQKYPMKRSVGYIIIGISILIIIIGAILIYIKRKKTNHAVYKTGIVLVFVGGLILFLYLLGLYGDNAERRGRLKKKQQIQKQLKRRQQLKRQISKKPMTQRTQL